MTELRYHRPARSWLDRLPLGNGRIGAMVGADESSLHISLNEASVWSGSPGGGSRVPIDPETAAAALATARAAMAADDPQGAEEALKPMQHGHSQAFLPVGELVLEFSSSGERVVRVLDLADGVHRCEVAGAAGTVSSEVVVSVPDDALLISLACERPADIRLTFETQLRLLEQRTMRRGGEWLLRLPVDASPSHEPESPALTWERSGAQPLHVAVRVRVDHDGVATVSNDRLELHGVTRAVLALALETTFAGAGNAPESPGVARERASDRLAELDVLAGIAAHKVAHRARADAFQLTLGEARAGDPDDRVAAVEHSGNLCGDDPALLALLVSYGRYLLLAASRRDGPPANLQGLWNAEMQPPWSSNYTLNINLPMNYWGAELCGASDPHLALLNQLEALARSGRDTARRLYGARGWVAHHNSDPWGFSLPTDGDASWSQWPLGGAWLVCQFDWHRRFGAASAATLDRFWPVAEGCAEFLLDWLIDDGDQLVTRPSTSPENQFWHRGRAVAITESSALDRALIRDVLRTVVDLAEIRGIDSTVARRAAAARDRIAGPAVGRDGSVLEWGGEQVPVDPHHRHVSHLYPWYPGTEQVDGWREPLTRSLALRGDDSTGWSLAWKIGLRARLGDGESVGRLLNLVTRTAVEGQHRGGLYPNLFAAHPPFQIDGNLGLLGTFLEALIQSHQGHIELLPALPPGLDAGCVRGLIARPGVVVDMDWVDRQPVRLRLRGRVDIPGGRILLRHLGNEVSVELQPDEIVSLTWPRKSTQGRK